MLVSFKVKNFRAFRDEMLFSMEAETSKSKLQNVVDVTLSNGQELKLLKAAMILGANASGKSTFIRAFYNLVYFLIRKPNVDEGVWMYEPYLFDKKYAQMNSEFEIVFVGPQNIKYEYKIEFNKNQIVYESLISNPNGKPKKLFVRESEATPSEYDKVTLGKKEIKVFSNQLLLSKFGSDEPDDELTAVYKYLSGYDVINNINEAHKLYSVKIIGKRIIEDSELKTRIDTLIGFADTKIKGVQIEVDHNETKRSSKESINSPYIVSGLHEVFDNEQKTNETVPIHFSEESFGTQALYHLGGRILMALEYGIVLIVDELDASLHPFLTRMIVMMFQSDKLNPKNAQIVFTTHDMTLLDRDLIRRDQVWITEKNEKGASEMFSLQDFDGVRQETPFDKWYLAGKFGGLPTLKSIDSMFDHEPSLS